MFKVFKERNNLILFAYFYSSSFFCSFLYFPELRGQIKFSQARQRGRVLSLVLSW